LIGPAQAVESVQTGPWPRSTSTPSTARFGRIEAGGASQNRKNPPQLCASTPVKSPVTARPEPCQSPVKRSVKRTISRPPPSTQKFAAAIHAKYPGKLLAYNCSPSFNWKKKLTDAQIATFQQDLARLGGPF
jgi:hypothetical protein